MKVLLVEDEAALADVIRRNLQARGHETTIAGTAADAINDMASAWPDVLILDVNLPDYTGWEILRRLTSRDRDRLGVIVISAAPLSQKRIDEFQPLKWLQKPFPMDALIRLLAQVEPASAIERQHEAQ